MHGWQRRLTLAAQIALPILLAITLPPIEPGSGVLWPWGRNLADLDVYQAFGQVVLDGGNIITERAPNGLAFIYPPFAAILAVPLAFVPHNALVFGWTILQALTVIAVLHRCGLRAWSLSITAAVVLVLCEPIRSTLTYGQVNLFLMALVVLDLVPGPRLLPGKQLLPRGVLTGLASAVKLTPALFMVYLAIIRDRRAALISGSVLVGCTLLAGVLLPSATVDFAAGLIGGDTRTGGVHYIMNQSILGAMSRVAGGGDGQRLVGLALSAVVALVGAYAAARWYRRGKPLFAVSLCGLATLLASPISWNHHWVWIVPLGVALLDRELPYGIRATGWVLVAWVAVAPYKVAAPSTNDIELHWNAGQQIVVALTPIAGLVLVMWSALVALRTGRQGAGPVQQAELGLRRR